MPPVKAQSKSKNQPAGNVRAQLLRVTGVDLVAVSGISQSLAQTIWRKLGRIHLPHRRCGVSKFPTVKHFCSRLGLAPHNDISGGRVLRSRTLKTDNRAGQAFRQAARSNARSQAGFGAYYRRKCVHLDLEQELVVTAHKIARVVYVMLKNCVPYAVTTVADYDRQWEDRQFTALKKKAAKLGYTLQAAT